MVSVEHVEVADRGGRALVRRARLEADVARLLLLKVNLLGRSARRELTLRHEQCKGRRERLGFRRTVEIPAPVQLQHVPPGRCCGSSRSGGGGREPARRLLPSLHRHPRLPYRNRGYQVTASADGCTSILGDEVTRHSVEHRADRVRLYSVFPIAWSAFRMGYGYDRNSVVGEVVDNLVRESTNQHAPSAGLRIECANVRLSFNARRCFCHAVEEVSAQTRALLLVPAYGGSKLFASSGKGPNTSAHRPRRSRSIRRLATSQASSLAEPDSRAATRRLISAVQAEAASGSAGPSRLARSSEASSARPFKSRRSASARTVSVVFVMVPYISA